MVLKKIARKIQNLNVPAKIILGLLTILVCVLIIKNIDGLPVKDQATDQEMKSVSQKQIQSYEQVLEVARMVDGAEKEMVAEMENISQGKGDVKKYEALKENVIQYKSMFSEVEERHNCEFFKVCTRDDKKGYENPIVSSSEILSMNKPITEASSSK